MCGGLVLKQAQDVALAVWTQGLLARTTASGVRVPEPIRSDTGSWAVDGWIATEFVAGLTSLRSDPGLIIEAGEALSEALTATAGGDTRPVRDRRDRWARADRSAWGEEHVDLADPADSVARRLRRRTSNAAGPPCVVHGDLSGNVFVDPLGTPVVLDVTPYLRPRRYGSAIVVADNLLWHGAGLEIVDLIDGDEDALARALLFRLVAEQLADRPRHGARLSDYTRTLAILEWHP